jgi:hypothetical protein
MPSSAATPVRRFVPPFLATPRIPDLDIWIVASQPGTPRQAFAQTSLARS